MEEKNKTTIKRAISKKITPVRLSKHTIEFLEQNKWIKKSPLMRVAVDEKIKELMKGNLDETILQDEETEFANDFSSVNLYQDQEEFFEKHALFTKSKFVRVATDERVKKIKKALKKIPFEV